MLLLHGFLSDGAIWRDLCHDLPHRWLAVDLPGHGRSGQAWPPEGQPAWPWLWQQLDEIARDLGELPMVVGYSMGARIAASWALAHRTAAGDRPAMRGLVLESGHAGLTEPEAAERRRSDELLARQLETAGLAAFVAQWAAQPMFRSQQKVPADDPVRQAQAAGRLRQTVAGLAFALRAYGTGAMPNLDDCSPRPDVPALILAGAEDGKFVAEVPRWRGLFPDHCVHIEANCGHHVALEAPTAWRTAVGAFSAGLSAR